MEIAFAHFAQSGVHGWNHRRDNDATHLGSFNFVYSKKIAEEHAIFVNSVSLDGGHAPVGNHARTASRLHKSRGTQLIYAENRIGVANINHQQHQVSLA